jgi:glycosyltransferase involved in cell wall biosynthesis
MGERVDQRKVSIVIPAYNAESTLRVCLEGCLAQTHSNCEIVVVDDGSTDGTRGIAESLGVRCVTQENHGPAAARNRGAAETAGDFVAFTDADCVPEPDWIEQLLAGFEDGVVGVGGTYGIANPERLLARMVHEEIVARHAHYAEDVDFLGSFNVMFEREAFEEAGGFDEAFSEASAEDNDLSYRITEGGGRLRFASSAVVKHYHPWRLFPYFRAQLRHGAWRVKLYTKHPHRAGKGDRYAGMTDLLAPALSLLAAMALCHAALFGILPLNGQVPLEMDAVVLIGYALLRLGMPLRLVRATGDWRMFLFLPVLMLRDMARAMGMIAGIMRFIFLAKGGR